MRRLGSLSRTSDMRSILLYVLKSYTEYTADPEPVAPHTIPGVSKYSQKRPDVLALSRRPTNARGHGSTETSSDGAALPCPDPPGTWIPISSASVLSVYSVVRILRGLQASDWDRIRNLGMKRKEAGGRNGLRFFFSFWLCALCASVALIPFLLLEAPGRRVPPKKP